MFYLKIPPFCGISSRPTNYNFKPKFHDRCSMTSFLARVDSEPVSLPNFSLSSIFAGVNQQQVSLTIFYCPIDQRYFKE